YTGTSEEATLAALRTVSGEGVFYIRAHGGRGSIHHDNSTQDVYALWTASEVLDPEEEDKSPRLSDDLLLQRVVYMLFRNDFWSQQIRLDFLKARHYGITGEFISKYMSFSDDSLVYVDACNGASDPSFRTSFKNASVFVGWNERATMGAINKTSKYVF